ncbi:hypothetical protein, partial [Paenibacillus riograndensis]|uniref:hypothetical protein n=1 Tax=Paenibacillus riograndensis TaxID=483937 RepID=UPI001B7FDD08
LSGEIPTKSLLWHEYRQISGRKSTYHLKGPGASNFSGGRQYLTAALTLHKAYIQHLDSAHTAFHTTLNSTHAALTLQTALIQHSNYPYTQTALSLHTAFNLP